MARHTQIELPSDRSIGFLFAIVSGLIGIWLLWKDSRFATIAIGVAVLFLIAALTYPRVLDPLNIVWMHLGLWLNRIVSPVVLGIIYFGLLTPVGTLMRLRGRDVLQLRFDPAVKSYWIRRDPPGPAGSSFPRQF